MKLDSLYKKMSRWPLGRALFTRVATLKAPYFSTIHPLVSELTEISCVVVMKKRRRVLNHIGTVHAIAMCNMCELAFGLTMEAGIPNHLRWIPKGMAVRYLKKGQTDLTAVCLFPQLTSLSPGDHVVPVKITDTHDQVVMEADITVYVTEKPKL